MPNDQVSQTSGPSVTFNMRRQHKEILNICRELEDIISSNLKDNVEKAAMVLARLTGQLKLHLAMEDKVMYPVMTKHQDPKIRGLALRYQEEMGGLSQAYLGYAGKWHAQSIAADLVQFSDESRQIFTALRGRIDREDHELYPLVDTVGI